MIHEEAVQYLQAYLDSLACTAITFNVLEHITNYLFFHKDREEFIQYYLDKCNICLSDSLNMYQLRQYKSIRQIKDIIDALLYYSKDENKRVFQIMRLCLQDMQ